MIKTGIRLSDNELQGVNGGYIETFGFASGSDVSCPKCHFSNKDNFKVVLNLDKGTNDYECLHCHYKFSLD